MFNLWSFVLFTTCMVCALQSPQFQKTSNFSCKGRSTGYYADVSSGCQLYHMCDGLGRQFSYACPNATLFQQRMLICDHWYMVNCSKSEDDYSANLLIGQREKLFVDNSGTNQYHRTPRPDLKNHPSASEYNIIYQSANNQRNHSKFLKNVVGAQSNEDLNTTSTTNQPTYSLPSHWSTKYETTTRNLNLLRTTERLDLNQIKGKSIESFASNTRNLDVGFDFSIKNSSRLQNRPNQVNFRSFFRATTPVFPKSVEDTTSNPNSIGLLAPEPQTLQKPQVNYQSNFKATTPVYPTSVEATSQDPNQVGLLPPQQQNETIDRQDIPQLSLNIEPPSFDESSVSRKDSIIVEEPPKPPSIFYQPPKFLPDYTQEEPVTSKRPSTTSRSSTSKRTIRKPLNLDLIQDIQKKFSIPDYEFPLESASRPSYESHFDSFLEDDQSKK